MHIGQDILDYFFPARKPLRKAAGTPASSTATPAPQNTDYIKTVAQEAAKRQAERDAQAKKLTQPSSKSTIKILSTK